jgi:ABC-type nitrate/sulfonate/bicarbonate transport system substrate-binding protein
MFEPPQKMTQTRTLVGIFLAFLVTLGFPNDSSWAQTKRKITVTFVAPAISQSVAWITKEVGIFAKHGIDSDVILLTGSPRAVQTLLAGDIDYAIAGPQSAMRARFRGAGPLSGNDIDYSAKEFCPSRIAPSAPSRRERQGRRRPSMVQAEIF